MTYTNKNTFGEVCDTWHNTCFYWCKVIAEVVEIIGGARNPQEWGDHPYDLYEEQQKELLKFQEKNPEKRKKLVEILVFCQNKSHKKTIEMTDKKIFINVKDVHFILDEMKNVGIDIKNIRKYTDDELQNLLRQRRDV